MHEINICVTFLVIVCEKKEVVIQNSTIFNKNTSAFILCLEFIGILTTYDVSKTVTRFLLYDKCSKNQHNGIILESTDISQNIYKLVLVLWPVDQIYFDGFDIFLKASLPHPFSQRPSVFLLVYSDSENNIFRSYTIHVHCTSTQLYTCTYSICEN